MQQRLQLNVHRCLVLGNFDSILGKVQTISYFCIDRVQTISLRQLLYISLATLYINKSIDGTDKSKCCEIYVSSPHG